MTCTRCVGVLWPVRAMVPHTGIMSEKPEQPDAPDNSPGQAIDIESALPDGTPVDTLQVIGDVHGDVFMALASDLNTVATGVATGVATAAATAKLLKRERKAGKDAQDEASPSPAPE